jgi:hypothetical protein
LALPRVSKIARLMLVVAIVAIDCGLVRLFVIGGMGLGGVLVTSLAFSVGLLGAILARGPARRFSIGFVIATVVGVLFLSAAVEVLWPDTVGSLFTRYVGGAIAWARRTLPRWGLRTETEHPGGWSRDASFVFLLVIDLAMSLPILIVAFLGGLLALAVRRRKPVTPVPVEK